MRVFPVGRKINSVKPFEYHLNGKTVDYSYLLMWEQNTLQVFSSSSNASVYLFHPEEWILNSKNLPHQIVRSLLLLCSEPGAYSSQPLLAREYLPLIIKRLLRMGVLDMAKEFMAAQELLPDYSAPTPELVEQIIQEYPFPPGVPTEETKLSLFQFLDSREHRKLLAKEHDLFKQVLIPLSKKIATIPESWLIEEAKKKSNNQLLLSINLSKSKKIELDFIIPPATQMIMINMDKLSTISEPLKGELISLLNKLPISLQQEVLRKGGLSAELFSQLALGL